MKKNVVTLVIAALFTTIFFSAEAQNKEIEKGFARADKLLESQKVDEAEKTLKTLAGKFPKEYTVWDKFVETQLAIYGYKQQFDNLFANMSFTTTIKDSTGTHKVEKDDSLVRQLRDMLSTIKPSDAYKRHMLNTCRVACTQTIEATKASMTIRNYEIDKIFTSENKAAVKQFNLAEQEFGKKNYTSAANYYKAALELDPGYYKAQLYLGDVYFFTKHYDLSIQEFKKAVDRYPDQLEPRKYLMDAYLHIKDYEKAYQAGIDALLVYPDAVLCFGIENAARGAGYKCDLRWIARDVLPNSAKNTEAEKDDISIPMPKNSPWMYYVAAMEKVKSYCDKKGILADNPVTKQRYLELYSWEQMLEKSKDPTFDFARKMKDKGFLDCYVFISCFHYDIYDQYKDFVASNPGKIKQYIEMLKSE